MPNGNDWHLEKKVPIILIFMILGQTALGAYWVAQTNARLAHLEGEANINVMVIERLTRLEVGQDNIKASIKRQDAWIRRVRDDVTALAKQ